MGAAADPFRVGPYHRPGQRHLAGQVMLPRRRPALLAGRTPAPPPVAALPPLELLSDSEIRVLRYLPTSLIAAQVRGGNAHDGLQSPSRVERHGVEAGGYIMVFVEIGPSGGALVVDLLPGLEQ
jgi:hypothetical protein